MYAGPSAMKQRGDGGERRQRTRRDAQPAAIDRHAVFDGAALFDGLLDQPLDQARRVRRVSAP